MSAGNRSPNTRRVGRVDVPDVSTLRDLYHASLSRRLLFLHTSAPPTFGTTFDLQLVLAAPAAEIHLTAIVRFVADAHAPKGSGCGVEISESKDVIAQRVEKAAGASMGPVDDKRVTAKGAVSVVFNDAPAAASAPVAATAQPLVTPATGQRVALIVEDDADLQRVYARLLEPAGFAVMVAKDGVSAIEMFGKNPVALVIVDFLLPRLDGLKVAEKIFETRKVPLIFSSAMTRDTHIASRLKLLGVKWILEKPFRLEQVRKAFDEAIAAALAVA